MSGLLLLCTELTLFCVELPENCIYLHQSELSNFSCILFVHEVVNFGNFYHFLYHPSSVEPIFRGKPVLISHPDPFPKGDCLTQIWLQYIILKSSKGQGGRFTVEFYPSMQISHSWSSLFEDSQQSFHAISKVVSFNTDYYQLYYCRIPFWTNFRYPTILVNPCICMPNMSWLSIT